MASKLVCPCGKKLSITKHYDDVFEWFECPKCEGCYTYDELLEGGGKAIEEIEAAPSFPVAKGKERLARIAEEEEAIAAYEAEALKPVKTEKETKHRDDLRTGEVVNIIADEIQTVYEEMGVRIDEVNARDKALTLFRELHYHAGVSCREKPVQHVLCGVHGG